MDDAVTDQRMVRITLDEASIVRWNPDVDQERKVAIYDLLEDNQFALIGGRPGPYGLHLAIEENRLVFDVKGEDHEPLQRIVLAGTPFRRVVRDYFQVCESYFEAIKVASPSKIEAIDMGRRALHNDGAELLRERLAGKVEIDYDTARRLFTLICVLHLRG